MRSRAVGGRETSAIGVGTARFSLMNPDVDAGVRMLCAAFDAGVRLVDTAAVYVPGPDEPGHSERLVRAALDTWDGDRSSITVVTKGGHARVGTGWDMRADFVKDGSDRFIRQQCDESLTALGTERLDVLLLHWPDPAVPIAESMATLDALRREGKVAAVGLSNVSVAQLEEARAVGPVAAVQNRYSPDHRDSDPVVDACAEHDITFMAYSPLGGGGGAKKVGEAAPAFAEVAAERGVSVQQVVLAWELARAPVFVPIVGPSRPETARDSAAAAALDLTPDEIARLDGS